MITILIPLNNLFIFSQSQTLIVSFNEFIITTVRNQLERYPLFTRAISGSIPTTTVHFRIIKKSFCVPKKNENSLVQSLKTQNEKGVRDNMWKGQSLGIIPGDWNSNGK